MAKYPTYDEVFSSLSVEEIAEMVRSLPDYDTSEVILSLKLSQFPADVLNAWAELVEAIRLYGFTNKHTDKVSDGLSLSRELDYEEKMRRAISHEQSKRYYAMQEAEKAAAKAEEDANQTRGERPVTMMVPVDLGDEDANHDD